MLFITLKNLEESLLKYIENKNKYLVLEDLNHDHLAWDENDSITINLEAKDLIFPTLFNNLSQIIQKRIITYKEGNKKNTINVIFDLLLLAKKMQMYDTQITFDHNLDYLSILP